jgi:hypothetical protein
MDTIAELLGKGTLPDEVVESLQEAFNKKVAKAREEAEIAVREEMAARYEQDKDTLVEAMDRMLSDAVEKQAKADVVARRKFKEARDAFRGAKKKMAEAYNARLTDTQDAARKFVAERTVAEVKKLHEARAKVLKDRLRVAEALETEKKRLAEQQTARITKIDEFITRQVAKELKELNEDHKALVKTRVKLVSESRRRLADTQRRFVKESAKRVEQAINTVLKKEMTQLHEDLEKNRQNMFGRRIFEAVAAEYLTSYLAEGTEIRNLQKVIESKEAELSSTRSKLSEAEKVSEAAARKARLAEDRAVRTKVMGELLGTLRGEKRSVMEGMLETVKTEALRETFQRLLPVVLSEGTRKAPPSAAAPVAAARRPLREEQRETRVVTGDNRASARLHEAANRAESEFDSEVAQVVRLAGIHNK